MTKKFLILLAVLIICSCNTRTPGNKDAQEGTIENIEDTSSFKAVRIDSTSFSGLRVYYPSTSVIALTVGSEPNIENDLICFVCAAAYTGRSIFQHPDSPNHFDVAGDHIEGGNYYSGYDDSEFNSGGFIWYPGPNSSWEIVDREEFKRKTTSTPLPFSAFQQELLIHNNQIQKFHRSGNRANYYRALCSLNGELCIIDGTREHMLFSFIDLLKNAGVSDALYLDMGGWRYSWYRELLPDDNSPCPATIIYEKPQSGYYGSNWLVFYSVN